MSWSKGIQPGKGEARSSRPSRSEMEKRDIEDLREKVGCAALLEQDGWSVDIKESTRRAVKFRRGDGEIVIVIHEGRGWFDPLSPNKGDVFDLAEHLGAAGFPEAFQRVAGLIGFVPSTLAWQRPARQGPPASVRERWQSRLLAHPGSASWRYLSRERTLPDDVLAMAVAADLLREGPRGSMWAAHHAPDGSLTGWEERGPHWRGFATDGAKQLFRFGRPEALRICVSEAAIDAMSLAVIEVMRRDTLYVSTGGGWSPLTNAALRSLARRTDAWLVAATDNNRQGEVYAERIREIAREAKAGYARSRPRAEDWNDELRNLTGRLGWLEAQQVA